MHCKTLSRISPSAVVYIEGEILEGVIITIKDGLIVEGTEREGSWKEREVRKMERWM